MPEPISTEQPSGTVILPPITKRFWVIMTVLISLWCCLRMPIIFRQLPAQDEDYFAVAGWTILEEGLPRIPYMPTEDESAAFYRADRVLYLLPPMFFYAEAGAFAVLGPSTGVARLASALFGIASVVLLFFLTRRWFRSNVAATWASGLYLFSRVIYFPCVIARPDMLCGFWGLLAIFLMTRWFDDPPGQRATRWLIGAGLAIGCGFLTHPFSLVFALQIGVWALLASGSILARVRFASWVTGTTLITLTAWIPLILVEPDIFRIQFGNNVFNRSGPGLLSRLVWPFEAVHVQSILVREHAGLILFALLLAFVIALIVAIRSKDPRLRLVLLLAGSGLYLHIAAQGTHPTKGYWVYTLAPFYALIGWGVNTVLDRSPDTSASLRQRLFQRSIIVSVLMLTLLGTGLRTVVVHLRNWNHIAFDAPRLTQRVLETLPEEGVFVVDPGFAFESYLSGRQTLLGLNFPFFYDVSDEQYDILVGGYFSERDGVPEALDAQPVMRFPPEPVAEPDAFFAYFATIYTAPDDRRATNTPLDIRVNGDPEP